MSKELVKLSELHHDVQVAFKNDALKLLLNQQPHDSWVKKHPMTKNPYLPIDKVEFMLDRIFQEWKVEVVREGVMFNSIYVTVRLHYKDPVTGEWRFHDGVGAKACQLDSGSKSSQMENIKEAAVMMALPIAKSLAIKDAADHLGKLFGRDLNRKDTVNFAGAYTVVDTKPDNNYDTKSNDLPL
jgi:hypothetical protein